MSMVLSTPVFHLSCLTRVGGVGVVWCGVVVASVCPSSGQTHRTSSPTVVASLMIQDNMFVYMYVHVHVHVPCAEANCH